MNDHPFSLSNRNRFLKSSKLLNLERLSNEEHVDDTDASMNEVLLSMEIVGLEVLVLEVGKDFCGRSRVGIAPSRRSTFCVGLVTKKYIHI